MTPDLPPPPFAPARPAPMPAQMLGYSIPARMGRPGILTAVGVMSIVIACLSGLSSLSGIAQAGMLMFMSSKWVPAPTPPTGVAVATVNSGWTVNLPSTVPSATQPATVPAAAPSAPVGLTPAQIQTVVQRVQAMTSNGLSPAQATALQTALANPSTPLVSPNYVYSPVQSATTLADGGVDVQFNGGGYIILGPAGQVASQGGPGSRPFGRTGFPRISPAVGVLLGGEALVSLVLAVLLLVAGIMVFRGSQRAPRLHRLFAVCKIPAAVVAAAGTFLMYKQMMASLGSTTGAPAYAVFGGMAGASLLLSCAYPVALLIVLRSRGVRAYYASTAAG